MLLKSLLVESKTDEELILEFIKNIIKGSKFENKTFVAGGYVRDMIMHRKSKDIDITVALPNGGVQLAEFLTKKTNSYKKDTNPVIFLNFGTAKFNLRGIKYKGVSLGHIDLESVMTRKEQYHDDSRNPEVSFGTPEQDVERRDLTINSLLYDISNERVLDLTGKGINDIKNKIIRTPLDSNIIFKEDPLRMMRSIRFATRYGWDLSVEMQKSIKKNANRLEIISKERIQNELNKILLSNHPDKGIIYLMDTNLMKYIIPEYYELKDLTQSKHHEWDVLNHSLHVLKNSTPCLEVRLAALLHDLGKADTKSDIDGKIQFLNHEAISSEKVISILRDLKYDMSTIKKVSNIVFNHMKAKNYGYNAENVSDKALRRLMHTMGNDLEDLLDLIHADNISHGSLGWKYNMEHQVDNIREKLKSLGDFTVKLKMPVDGYKIMKWLDIKGGPEIGQILSQFKDLFFDNPEKINNMSDEMLEKIIKKIYNKIKK